MEEKKQHTAEKVLMINTLSRKERREAEIYQPVLTDLVNQYLQSRQNTESKIIEGQVFKSLNMEWMEYVRKWNRNKKHVTVLRESDFFNFMNTYLLNEEKKRNEKKKR